MPRVCIDCRYIGPRPSGIARVVWALVDHLPTIAPDIDFLLLKTPAAPDSLSMAPNVSEVVVRAAANSPTTMWRLPDVVDFSDVDLFHATFNIMPARLTMPCITTVHDIMWVTNPEWCNARFSKPVEAAFYRHGIMRALRRARAITTVSQASKSAISAFHPAAAERTFVTPLGVAPAFIPGPADPEALAALGLPRGRRFVLTVGQYVPYKNHERAMEAFAAAFPEDSGVDLVFVQRLGTQPPSLRQLAESLRLTHRVHFLREVGQGGLVTLYRAAIALLHPSFCEGFGLPLIEAMASGCPVVTSDRSAMAEVVGDAGLLASPDDTAALATALRTIADSPLISARMREAGISRSMKASWSDFAKATMEIYRMIL